MSTPAVVPETQPALSEGARLINVFFAPSKTFTDIRRNASWWMPWLVLSLVSIAFAFTVQKKVTFEQAVLNTFRLAPKQAEKIEQAPPEQRARIMNIQVISRKVTSYAWPLWWILLFLIGGAIYMATFNFGLGAEVSFKQSMAVVAFSSLPGIFKSLLAMVAMFMPGFDPEGFILQNPAATNLGALISEPAQHMTLWAFLSSLDIIAIWCTVLMGIGYACISKVKRGTAIGVMFGWYLFFMLLGVGVTAIFA